MEAIVRKTSLIKYKATGWDFPKTHAWFEGDNNKATMTKYKVPLAFNWFHPS